MNYTLKLKKLNLFIFHIAATIIDCPTSKKNHNQSEKNTQSKGKVFSG